ncbi:MAG: phosphoserine phosphatase SerB [Hydrogenovibrio sp.]|nr:phosphoserine phosphatase SerB [Hydrogenovibrio sp.]
MAKIIFHTDALTEEQQTQIESKLNLTPIKVANHYQVETDRTDRKTLQQLSETLQIDINLLPDTFSAKEVKLVISDMDSTLIGIECVDEIADMMQIKPQVAAITEAAMRGELDFAGSLKQRVQLLKGLPESALKTVYEEHLFLNPGAEEWLTGLKSRNIAFALVSGGFTYFTDRLKKELDIDYTRSNKLHFEDGILTGEIEGDIVGPEAKAAFLLELCGLLNIKPAQVIAIGDGANDLMMMAEAGLSIAYRAKPTVQEHSMTALNFSALDKVLDFIDA